MVLWSLLIPIILFQHTEICYSRILNEKAIHHGMTKAELQKYFGVNDPHKVPEYEISHPFSSNEHGDFVTHDVTSPTSKNGNVGNNKFYKIKAFGSDLLLNVTWNKHVLGPDFRIETIHKNGTVTTNRKHKHVQHLLGNVASDPESMVAISNDNGLEGMVKLKNDSFFVHPLPKHLVSRRKRSLQSTPHLIVRRNAEGNLGDVFETVEGNPANEDNRRNSGRQRRSTTTTVKKYLKTAFVVDQYTVNRFGEDVVTAMLPVLANIVSGIFQDQSIGDMKLHYVLNKIVIVNNGELSYAKEESSLKLTAIGDWSELHNPASESDVEHLDTVTLISVDSGLYGLAVYDTICRSKRSTSLAEINGLNAAALIAHEIFHSLGGGHDSTEPCADGAYIMASTTSSGTAGFSWSECSRNFIQGFLNSQDSACLDDAPASTVLRTFQTVNKDVLLSFPGVLYNADQQCEIWHGSGYISCINDQCSKLFCRPIGSNVCSTLTAPPIDGTKCGERKWCVKGVCVDDGLAPIDGGWSEWSQEYSECTRTCGGGIHYKTRQCNNPSPRSGGNDCEGSAILKSTCNTQACPGTTDSFRLQQCQEINPDYSAYFEYGNECSLVCKQGSLIYYHGGVTDGTRCYQDKNIFDICVDRKCKKAGCDHILGSRKVLDRCGVCGGDGSTCSRNSVYYTQTTRDSENLVAEIPEQATNIFAIQDEEDYNKLGISDSDGNYIIDGYDWSKMVDAAGTTIEYDHEEDFYVDTISIAGPTTEPLKLLLFRYYGRYGSIDLSYYLPGGDGATTTYGWEVVSSWTDCSETCAGGLRTRDVVCVRNDDYTNVNEENCDASSRPHDEESCNTQACIPEWYETKWGGCSVSCGKGTMTREGMICRQQVTEFEWRTVDDTLCTEPKLTVSVERSCNEFDCPPIYAVTDWSACSKTCDAGTMTREFHCQKRTSTTEIEILPEYMCEDYHDFKPALTASCNENVACNQGAVVATTESTTLTTPAQIPASLAIGCYKDDSSDRTLTLLANFRSEIDWYNMQATIDSCALAASAAGYQLYAIQFYGECYAGHAGDDFEKYGVATNCWEGVGAEESNYVYYLM